MKHKLYSTRGKVWKYGGMGGWHFLYVGKKESQEIRDSIYAKKVGWSFVKVKATIGNTSWKTTLFPTKEGPFLIAIKAAVRKKEDIFEGDTITVIFSLL